MIRGMLSEFRETYAGPWPRAVVSLLTVSFGGPAVATLLTGEPFSLRLFAGSALVAIAAFLIGVWSKYHTKVR